MTLSTCLIDTFTSIPFKGNPTMVCRTDEDLSQQNMLSIAGEMNCPVTAFVKKKAGETDLFDISYFTATTEIPACGHATLAAAKFLQEDANASKSFRFCTINNIVIRTFIEDEKILMSYPEYKMERSTVDSHLLASLHLEGYQMAGYSEHLETLFIEVDSPDTLRFIEPDFQKLVESSETIKEVVVTSVSDNRKYDYYLRSFCPWIGINEDPVTGSVHSVLGNFWKQRLHKSNMNVYQASPRGGEISVRAFDDRVEIGGEAMIIFRGEIKW